MTPHLYLAILWTGARIVPESERAEWQAEWQTELWYAMREGDGSRAASFCLGSLRDALWKRTHPALLPRSVLALDARPAFPDPPPIDCPHLLESPFHCLALLAVLAILATSVGYSAPGEPFSGNKLLINMLPITALFWPVVALTSGATPGEYPRHRNWLGRGCFHLAKLALLLPITAFGASALTASPVRLHIAFAGLFLALRWTIADQRRRCPTCLRILDKPVRMGSGSRILLEWNGAELLCLRGHGVMQVPASAAIWFRKQRWMSLF